MSDDPRNHNRIKESWRAVVRALATSLAGTIVLSFFLQEFLADQALAGLLPIIVSFNAAVAGFTLLKSRRADTKAARGNVEQDTTTRYEAAALGGMSALLGLGILSLLGYGALTSGFFGLVLLVVACVGGLVCGTLGAWIASKQAELSEAKA